MSAPVTEAHIALSSEVLFKHSPAPSFVGASAIKAVAQLIADSEALACAELRALVGTIRSQLNLIPRNVGDITPDGHSHETGAAIDQLRAEAERLKRDYDYDHKCLHEVRERCELWKQRAERAECEVIALKAQRGQSDYYAAALSAEAELHALRLICGTTDADKFSTWVDRANARAEEAEHDCRVLISRLNVAEAELANIRALANRRNKRDHVEDTTHQLVAALDQALDIAQAELAAERARLKEMAAELAHCAGYIASVRTDRQITWHEELYALQTVEWAEGAVEIAEKANAVLEAHDAAMKEGAS